MATSSPLRKSITLEQFLARPEQKPVLEYLDGRIEAKVSPQKKHSLMTLRLLERLNRIAEPAGLGLAWPELRCTFAGRSIVPDVVFLLETHIASDERGEPVNETSLPPDIHIEIVSPDQSVGRSREKLAHSTAHGCPLGWLINPERQWIDVYRPGQAPERLAPDGFLDGAPVLPGFRVSVPDVFGWLCLRPPAPGPGPV